LKVLLVDFYDSFTFNIHHYLWSLGAEVVVVEHDNLDLNKLNEFTHIVLSPGPGLPREKKNMFEILDGISDRVALLGICLGMQGIAEHDGAQLFNLDQVRHGVAVNVVKAGSSVLFGDLPEKFQAGLYHSWAVQGTSLRNFKITAWSEEGVVMALEHLHKRVYAVQFHPESILTPGGKKIIYNFIMKG
jgi:anthranilate synthase component 2